MTGWTDVEWDAARDLSCEIVELLRTKKADPRVALVAIGMAYNAGLVQHGSVEDCAETLSSIIETTNDKRPEVVEQAGLTFVPAGEVLQ